MRNNMLAHDTDFCWLNGFCDRRFGVLGHVLGSSNNKTFSVSVFGACTNLRT